MASGVLDPRGHAVTVRYQSLNATAGMSEKTFLFPLIRYHRLIARLDMMPLD